MSTVGGPDYLTGRDWSGLPRDLDIANLELEL